MKALPVHRDKAAAHACLKPSCGTPNRTAYKFYSRIHQRDAEDCREPRAKPTFDSGSHSAHVGSLGHRLRCGARLRVNANPSLASPPAVRAGQLWLDLVRNSLCGVAVLDRDMRYLAVNRRWKREHGLTDDAELVGRSHYDMFPEIPDRWRQTHRNCLAGATEECFGDRLVHADGRFDWIHWSISPWRDEQGVIGGVTICSNLITDRLEPIKTRRHLRIELRQSIDRLAAQKRELAKIEQRVRLTVDQSPIGLAMVALDGHFISVNKTLCAMLGFSEAELLGLRFQDLTHRDDLEADLAHARDLLDGRTESYRMEKRYIHKDGAVIVAQLDVAIVRDEAGRTLHFISQIQDITERRASERKLRESEERFRLMVDGAVDHAIFMLDARGNVMAWNLGAQRMKGYATEEIIGHHFSRFYSEEDRRAGQPDQALQITAATGRREYEGWRLRKDGSRFWAGIILTAMRNDDGELIGFSKVSRDLTTRKKLEDQQRILTERLTLALRATGMGVWDWNVETNALEGDDTLCRIYGVLPGTPLDYTFWRNAVVPEDIAGAEETLVAAIARKASDTFTFRIKTPDSGVRHIESSFNVVLDQAQNVVRLIGINLDATATHNAAEALKKSEAEYRLLVDGMPDGVVSIDDLGIIHSFSVAAERIFGRPSDQVIGQNVAILMPARFRVGHDLHVSRFALHQDARLSGMRRELVGLRADGSEFPMMLALNAVPGSSPARFVVLVTDLTEPKRVEAAFAEAAQMRDTIARMAPYGIMSCQLNGIIRYVNPAAERLLGYGAEELVGKLTPAVFHDREEVALHVAELRIALNQPQLSAFDAMAYKARQGLVDDREWIYVRKDSSRFIGQLALSSVRDAGGTITGFVAVLQDISERKRREDHTQHIAHHDHLTGLPNRVLLEDRLAVAMEHARRNQRKLALMLVDLDHFKRINDSLGHHVGDEVLKVVAKRLLASVRASDTVVRMGGDEFVVLLDELIEPRDAEAVAAKIVAGLRLPIPVNVHELIVSPSIGLSFFPDDADSGGTLLKHADLAMYRAKASGRGCVMTFNRSIAKEANEQMQLESAMRRAVRDDGFEIHYQPQIAVDSAEVVGMEALLRWNDPEHGAVAPSAFIAIAEDTGLIVSLGEWVLRQACVEARDLQQRCGKRLRLAVNISARQFRHGNLVTAVTDALTASGLAPEDLELEITESVLMADADGTADRLRDLRQLGVRIAIDDFGVGFSSLSYIGRFPIDTLKIDRSFIQELPGKKSDAAVVEAVMAMAAALELDVVAEGVESPAQFNTFVSRRLHASARASVLVQGFCLSPAVSADQFAADFPSWRRKVRRLYLSLS